MSRLLTETLKYGNPATSKGLITYAIVRLDDGGWSVDAESIAVENGMVYLTQRNNPLIQTVWELDQVKGITLSINQAACDAAKIGNNVRAVIEHLKKGGA